ncbi:MAG: FTR1 family protein [Candidatus Kapaibacterium sp.]|jgi:high-affinity iron transporter
MFEQLFNQFVIAFREGIEASLIIMIVMMALKQRGQKQLQRAAYAGIWTAILACAIGGYLLGTIALVNNHGLEVILYAAAGVTVLTMVFWMLKTGKTLRSGIQTKIKNYGEQTGMLPLLGIFAFVFFMIAREGFEMVLLLLAFGAGVGGHYYIAAMLLGIGCAVLVSYSLSRGFLKIDLGRFLQSTAIVLLIFVVQLVFDVWHEGIEGQFIPDPSSQALGNFIDYVHDQVPIFSYIGLGLFGVLMVYFFTKAVSNKTTPKLPTPGMPGASTTARA